MEKRNTKDKILIEALNLFSVRGFEGVTVKDIAGAVGIKDSSLYKHYKGKQDIFDCLLFEMNKKFEDAVSFSRLPQGELTDEADQYGKMSVEMLQESCRLIFLFFLKDPYASKFRRMVTIEQYKNTWAKDAFQNFFLISAIEYLTSLFARMIELEYFVKALPDIMAMQFYSPIFMMMYRYDREPEEEDKALEIIANHVEQFYENYKA